MVYRLTYRKEYIAHPAGARANKEAVKLFGAEETVKRDITLVPADRGEDSGRIRKILRGSAQPDIFHLPPVPR